MEVFLWRIPRAGLLRLRRGICCGSKCAVWTSCGREDSRLGIEFTVTVHVLFGENTARESRKSAVERLESERASNEIKRCYFVKINRPLGKISKWTVTSTWTLAELCADVMTTVPSMF